MTRAQGMESILSGAEIVEAEIAQGLDILGTGDMGMATPHLRRQLRVRWPVFTPPKLWGAARAWTMRAS